MRQRVSEKHRAGATILSRFLRSDGGVAVVETVLTMGLIAGLVILATATLNEGTMVKDPFAEIAQVQADTPKHPQQVAASTAKEQVPAVAQQRPRTRLEHGALLIATCWTALLLGVVLAGHRHIQNRKEKRAEEEDEVEESPDMPDIDHRFTKRQEILRILTRDMKMLLESRMTVGQLMSRVVTVIPGSTRKDEMLDMMKGGKIRHLMVCRDRAELQGVISDRDVHQKEGDIAMDIMTANPITVSPDSPINPAVTQLIEKHISCLPVVEDGRLIGVLTTTDLMLALQCSLQVLHRLAMDATRDEPEAESEEPQLAAAAL